MRDDVHVQAANAQVRCAQLQYTHQPIYARRSGHKTPASTLIMGPGGYILGCLWRSARSHVARGSYLRRNSLGPWSCQALPCEQLYLEEPATYYRVASLGRHVPPLQHATQGPWGLSRLLKDGHRLWTQRLQVVVQRDPPHSAPQVFRCACASASPAGSLPQVPDDARDALFLGSPHLISEHVSIPGSTSVALAPALRAQLTTPTLII